MLDYQPRQKLHISYHFLYTSSLSATDSQFNLLIVLAMINALDTNIWLENII